MQTMLYNDFAFNSIENISCKNTKAAVQISFTKYVNTRLAINEYYTTINHVV